MPPKNITHLPPELLTLIMTLLPSKIDSLCLGLTHSSLYRIHFSLHGPIGLFEPTALCRERDVWALAVSPSPECHARIADWLELRGLRLGFLKVNSQIGKGWGGERGGDSGGDGGEDGDGDRNEDGERQGGSEGEDGLNEQVYDGVGGPVIISRYFNWGDRRWVTRTGRIRGLVTVEAWERGEREYLESLEREIREEEEDEEDERPLMELRDEEAARFLDSLDDDLL